MQNIVKPARALSFEDALRNLTSRLTGTPVAELPRTQEAIVQYMAEHITLPESGGVDVNELAEAITQEVMARLEKSTGANTAATEPAREPQDGAEGAGGTVTPPADETPREAAQADTEGTAKPKTTRKTAKAKAENQGKDVLNYA